MVLRFTKSKAIIGAFVFFLFVLLRSRYRSWVYDAIIDDKPTEIHSLRYQLSKFMNVNGVVTMTLFDKLYIPWAMDFHRNMKHRGINNLVMISLDDESQSFAELHNLPSLSIHCVLNSCIPYQSSSSSMGTHSIPVPDNINAKTSTLRALIEAGIHVLFVEMDVLIYKDLYQHPMIKRVFSGMELDMAMSSLTVSVGIIASLSNVRTKLFFNLLEENWRKSRHGDHILWHSMLENAGSSAAGKEVPALTWLPLDDCLFAEILPAGQNRNICKVKQERVHSHHLTALAPATKTERFNEFYNRESSAPIIAYVSGYTGSTDPHSVSLVSKVNIPQVPLPGHSFFITNINELKDRVRTAGWRPLHISVDDFNMTDEVDIVLAGKRMKIFPQKFLPVITNGTAYTVAVWFDNKFNINERAVSDVAHMLDSRVSTYFHKHPFLCCGADLELKESMYQNRYRISNETILRYMEEEVSLGFKIHGERHFQSGVIIYNLRHPDTEKIQHMWMQHIKRCGIQCQISLYFISQRFPDSIDEFTANISP